MLLSRTQELISSDADGHALVRFRYRGRDFTMRGRSAGDHLMREIARAGCFYEIDLLEYMSAITDYHGDGISIAVDVGANIGNHSVFFASFLVDHVLAVEPNPAVLSLLEANLAANGVSSSIHGVAVSDRRGSGHIVMPTGANGNVGMAQFGAGSEAGAESNSIPMITLDDLIEEKRERQRRKIRVALVKIDVEGMEVEVLRGAVGLLATDRPHVFAEAANRARFHEIRRFLAEFGYRPLSRWAVTPVYHFAHRPPTSLQWRARTLKLVSELHRPIELRRFVRNALGPLSFRAG